MGRREREAELRREVDALRKQVAQLAAAMRKLVAADKPEK